MFAVSYYTTTDDGVESLFPLSVCSAPCDIGKTPDVNTLYFQ